MRFRKFHLIRFFILSFLLGPFCGFAQQEYSQFYVIENILSKELIKSVAKDSDGYLWIATDDGILRYDGYQTRLFYKELPSQYTKAFLKRRNGQFYVLHDFGVKEIVKTNDSIYFRPLTLGEKVFDVRLSYPKSIYEDREENVWIGEFNAVLRFNENGLKRFDLGEEFRSIDYHRTFSFAEDAFGNLWIAPWKGPLLFYDQQHEELQRVNTDYPLTEVCSIVNVKGDYLLIGGKEGVLKLKVDSNHSILEQDFNGDIRDVSTIRWVGGTNVYVGTWYNGLFYYDFGATSSSLTKLVNVPFNDIVELYVDESKDELWVAGSENIGLFKPTIVSTVHQAGQNRIEALALDEQNHLYYSIGRQLFYLDRISNGVQEQILSADNTYFDRILCEGTRLWIGDAFGAIFYYDLKSKSKRYLLRGTDVSIKYLSSDHAGNKWFAGHSAGLIKVNGQDSLKFYPELTQTVLVRESGDGKVYCGRNGKQSLLSIYDSVKDTFDPVELKFQFDCPESIVLSDFQFDDNGMIWLATDEGLLRVDSKTRAVTKLSIQGLNENDPLRAVAIAGDYICFANTQGLVVYRDGEYILFTQDSGLPSKLVKERGLMLDKEGNLLVATAKGLAIIEKKAIRFLPTLQPVFKTVTINGVAVDPHDADRNTYPYKTKVEAEFISLSYPASNIVYQSRITGIDKDWSIPSANRNLNVLGFSEGSYDLEVRAREDGKLWSPPLTLHFRIDKPWYRKWWAILLFIGAGIATVILATRIHNNNLIRQKRNLQKIIEERTEEVNRQKNEIIEQQKKLIHQKEELIAKNEAVYKSQQALNEADMNYLQLKEKQLQDQIEYKNKQITTHALNILQKNETLRELKGQLEDIVKNSHKISVQEIRKTVRTIDESFKLDKDWEDFKLYFEQIHTGFYAKLTINYPDLTPLELRHCALIRLNLTLSECASILGISNDSIKVSRTRLRKKLNLDPNQSLSEFILGI